MDERARAEHVARRGLAFAIIVPTVLLGVMWVAWCVGGYFFFDLGLG